MDEDAQRRVRDREGKYAKHGGKRWLLAIIPLIFILLGFWFMFRMAVEWHDDNEIIFNKILTLTWQEPWMVQDRVVEIVSPVVVYDIEVDTPVEQLICDTFGNYECKTALAVAEAESGIREDAIGVNVDSVDIGIFQINSVHFSKEGCSLAEVATAEGNIACAKQLFDEQGWNIWSVVSNGSVGKHL